MTTKQFVADCINEMLPDLEKFITAKAEYYLSCGAIDLESFEDNYILPKAILHTIVLNDLSWQYTPHTKEAKALVKNLGSF